MAPRGTLCLGLNYVNDLCFVGQHVIESVFLVHLWMKFTPAELVKVTW